MTLWFLFYAPDTRMSRRSYVIPTAYTGHKTNACTDIHQGQWGFKYRRGTKGTAIKESDAKMRLRA